MHGAKEPSSGVNHLKENPSISTVRDLRAASCGPIGTPTITTDLSENIILTSLDDIHNWARLKSEIDTTRTRK